MHRQINDEVRCVGARQRGHRNAERIGLQLSVLRFARSTSARSSSSSVSASNSPGVPISRRSIRWALSTPFWLDRGNCSAKKKRKLRCVRQSRECSLGNGPLSEEAISDFNPVTRT
jgi:hypothetical protein